MENSIEQLISWMTENAMLCRIIFTLCGMSGLAILLHTRSYFYKDKHPLWWGLIIVVYSIIGPLILLAGLLTLAVDYSQNKK